jgi:hypothetical protein
MRVMIVGPSEKFQRRRVAPPLDQVQGKVTSTVFVEKPFVDLAINGKVLTYSALEAIEVSEEVATLLEQCGFEIARS